MIYEAQRHIVHTYDDHMKTTAKIVKIFVVEATITTTTKLTINSATCRDIGIY